MDDHPRHILVVSCLIRNDQKQILLVRHKKRGWELPQGRIEEGESLQTALHREVQEETGVKVHEPELALIWSKISAPAAKIFCFKSDYLSGELTTSDETPEVEWCSAEEAERRIDHQVNHDRLVTLLAHEGPLQFRSYTTGPYRVIA